MKEKEENIRNRVRKKEKLGSRRKNLRVRKKEKEGKIRKRVRKKEKE